MTPLQTTTSTRASDGDVPMDEPVDITLKTTACDLQPDQHGVPETLRVPTPSCSIPLGVPSSKSPALRSATFMLSSPPSSFPKDDAGLASRNDATVSPRSDTSTPIWPEPELLRSSDPSTNTHQSHVTPTPGGKLKDTGTDQASPSRSPKYHEALKNLSGLCPSDRVLQELALLPDPQSIGSVPDYFEKGELSVDKLPPHLKGLSIKLDQSHLTSDQVNLLIFYCCVQPAEREKLFTANNTPGACEDFTVIVDVSDKTPWSSRLIPCSPADHQEIQKIIHSHLEKDLIEIGHGPYAAACLLVRKTNGRNKIACCLNTLNDRSRKNSYPVPLIQDNLDSLANRLFISAFDICGGYLSMLIDPKDRDYFAFITAFGLFRWKRVPYGWRNAGANFCHLMDRVLINLKYQIVVSYVDDVICFGGRSFYEHLRCIRLVMDRIQKHGMTLAISKCSFCLKVFNYLGFQVSREGIQPNAENVEKILNANVNSLADARQFVGMCQFYRRWIPLFSQLVAPLYEVLKVKWANRDVAAVNAALHTIKTRLSTYPVLRHADFDRPFHLATDGSLEGFGAILQQKCPDTGGLYVIAYASAKLPPSMKALAGPQIEAAAACWAMNRFRHYLIGKRFTLLTDQVVLKHMKNNLNPPRSIMASILESQEFDYDVTHVAGTRHQAPDFMSRVAARQSPVDTETIQRQNQVYMNLTHPTVYRAISQRVVNPPSSEFQDGPSPVSIIGYDDWVTEQRNDSYVRGIRKSISNVSSSVSSFYLIHDDLVCYQCPKNRAILDSNLDDKPRVVVPSCMWSTVFRIAHDKFGHRGVKPTLRHLCGIFYWAGMSKFIRRAVRGCLDCRRRKSPKPRHAGMTKSVLTSKPGEVFYIDFLNGELPLTELGYKWLLVVVDGFTRYPFAIPLREKKAAEVAENLLTHVFCHTGLPLCVHSDGESDLVSESMLIAYENMGIRKTQSALRHPQGNAPAERFNRYLNEALSIVLPAYTDWPRMIPMILFAYRALVQETTGYSPFYMMYGRHPLLPLGASTIAPFEISPHAVDAELRTSTMVKAMADTFEIVRDRQDRASRINAARRDDNENRYPVSFAINDLVLIHEPDAVYSKECSVRPYVDKLAKFPKQWTLPWSGPHRISSRAGNDDVYKVYHVHRHVILPIHVDAIIPFHPFNDIPLSGIPQAHHRTAPPSFKDPSRRTYGAPAPAPVAPDLLTDPVIPATYPPLRTLKGPDSISELQPGDLFLATIPFNGMEPVSLMQFIAYDLAGIDSEPTDDTPVIARWMGQDPHEFHINLRFQTQRWLPGWYQPKTGEFYFQKYPLHRSHPPFTNVISVDTILRKDIFLFGFKLQEQKSKIRRLPTEVVQLALSKFRTMDIPEITEKNYMPGNLRTREAVLDPSIPS